MVNFSGKHIHFIGVGGISMSALARLMSDYGCQVSGSDRVLNEKMIELSCLGVNVYEGSNTKIVEKADLVVFSSAIKTGDIELDFAFDNNMIVYERNKFLGLISKLFDKVIAIAGVHGKTTVTGMIASALKSLDMNFVGLVGGDCVGLGNYVLNKSKGACILLTEACEYKKSLLFLNPDIGVVTNIDIDHPDCYDSIESVKVVFRKFLSNSIQCVIDSQDIEAFEELNIFCDCASSKAENKPQLENSIEQNTKFENKDNLENKSDNKSDVQNKSDNKSDVQKKSDENYYDRNKLDRSNENIKKIDTLKKETKDYDNYLSVDTSDFVVTGVVEKNNLIATIKYFEKSSEKLRSANKDVHIEEENIIIKTIILGEHNFKNMLYAVSVLKMLGCSNMEIKKGLESFKGVSRRFEMVGKLGNAEVIFDYSHHPTEIDCAIRVAKNFGKVLVVFQPHTYSRTALCLNGFIENFRKFESVILMRTYSARELSSSGMTTDDLAREIMHTLPKTIVYTPQTHEQTIDLVKTMYNSYDVILFLGAGDIYSIKSQIKLDYAFCCESQNSVHTIRDCKE